MTASLFSEIDELPEAPEKPDSLFGDAVTEEETPKRTRKPRTPRAKKYDEDGNEIKATRAPRNAQLSEDLLETTVSIAGDLAPFAPTVAGVLVARAEVLTDGLMALSKGHPRTTAALKKVASAGKMAGLIEFALLIAFAGAVDFGKIPASSPLLDRIGYSEIIRDEKGKAVKDEHGLIKKNRMTIRDIRRTMGVDDSAEQDTSLDMPEWNPHNSGPGPDTGTGPLTMPPMNWVPR